MATLKIELKPEEINTLFDTAEYRLVIRDWVAAELARRELKPLLADPIVGELIKRVENARYENIKDEARKAGVDFQFRSDGTVWSASLTENLRREVRTRVQETVRETVFTLVNQALVDIDMQAYVDKAMQSYVNARLDRAIGQAIADKTRKAFS